MALSYSSLTTPGPAGPIWDGNGCWSRILSARSRLTSNQLELMNDGNATGSTSSSFFAMTKMHRFLPLRLTVLFTRRFLLYFFSPPPFSINHYRVALITPAQLLMLKLKNVTRFVGHRCHASNLRSLPRAFLSGRYLTLL